ncbi:MAG TPA: hypothetical protein ENH30_01435 [Nitrospirae bacterium]|nr:hypothetical protein [Nitrospirota bacterium]
MKCNNMLCICYNDELSNGCDINNHAESEECGIRKQYDQHINGYKAIVEELRDLANVSPIDFELTSLRARRKACLQYSMNISMGIEASILEDQIAALEVLKEGK